MNPLWITYAWVDNDEGDFDFLVQELHKAGIGANYDKIVLVPGRKLWSQIAARISTDSLAGWAYLITPNSVSSVACQEELSYALQRAIETQESEFPLIGLLHGVSIRDVPLPLRVRLCVNLANPDWIEEIRAAVAGTPPHRTVPSQEPFVVKYHRDYLARAGKVAIEIRPRFGEIRYWRWAFPSTGPQPVEWGTGPANGGGVGGIQQEYLEGECRVAGTPMKLIGMSNPISPSSSAYAVFDQKLPEKFFFGVAKEPFGMEANGKMFLVE